MRVALIGAQGVGKTTLFKALEKRYGLMYKFIETPSSYVWEDIKDAAEIERHYVLLLQSFYCFIGSIKTKKIIQDRSLLDCYVYNKTMGLPKVADTLLRKLCMALIGYYNYFFYIPAEFAAKADGKRNPDTQAEVDALFRGLFSEFGGEKFIEVGGTIDERLAIVCHYLDKK